MRVNEHQQHAFSPDDGRSIGSRRHGNSIREYQRSQSGKDEDSELALLTIINHTLQCTNTNTDDAGSA